MFVENHLQKQLQGLTPEFLMSDMDGTQGGKGAGATAENPHPSSRILPPRAVSSEAFIAALASMRGYFLPAKMAYRLSCLESRLANIACNSIWTACLEC